MWLYLIVSLTAFAGFLIGRRSERPPAGSPPASASAVLLLSTVFGLMRSEDRDFAARERDYYASQAARIGVALKERNASGRVTLLVFEELKETEEVEEFRRVLARFGECGDIAIRTVALAHPAALTGPAGLMPASFAVCWRRRRMTQSFRWSDCPGTFGAFANSGAAGRNACR